MSVLSVTKGKMLAKGKTKKIWEANERPGMVVVKSEDDITAGDGEKHDIIRGKAELSTATTCNVFSLFSNAVYQLRLKSNWD